jgi:hypothetical protein
MPEMAGFDARQRTASIYALFWGIESCFLQKENGQHSPR